VKIMSIGGARPQFVKMAMMFHGIEAYKARNHCSIDHAILHTGQHYDPLMSDIFFEELGLAMPHPIIGTSSGTPGVQTAAMLASIEVELMRETPDLVLIYGDTNSTLAAALAASKLHIPLVHIEAGLRSFNREMQEEINRIVSDHVSDLLLAPTAASMEQLRVEGLSGRAALVGDLMLDAVAHYTSSDRTSAVLDKQGLGGKSYALVTMHRAENTDSFKRLTAILSSLAKFPIPIVLPLHPRLSRLLGVEGRRMLASHDHIHLVEPVGYLEMLVLEQRADVIVTDSGGMQKEAYFLGTPCVTLRDETEWTETLHDDWNVLAGSEAETILRAVRHALERSSRAVEQPRNLAAFGGGQAAAHCIDEIMKFMEKKK
jgi:UDP-GlcNAc3NAcA epimerase